MATYLSHRHPRVSLPDAYRHQRIFIRTFVGPLVVEDGQRPAPAGELAGDRGVGDHGAFLALIEADPPRVQAPIGGLAACPRRGGGRVPASAQILSGPIPGSVMPGGFDQQPAGVAVAGFGDPPCTRVDPEEYSVGTNPR